METNHWDDASYYDVSLAVIGMAGRFPGASDVNKFWQNLRCGVSSIRTYSDEELLAKHVDPTLLADPNYVKAGTELEGLELFDAPFFGFTPREAEAMDPQTRLFFQVVWSALEDAGYDPGTYNGRIGIFAGKHPSNYKLNVDTNPQVAQMLSSLQLAGGHDADGLASMVAYKLDLKGPSVSVQTFCSTSMVAVHLACQSLLTYDSDMAIAGGVALEVPHGVGYLYQEGGILSPDGACRTFDANANGSVLGNGGGVVVLKRMEDALEDGDHIYAVVRGSAMNNDGITRVSYAAPGLNGQAAVIATALGNAGVDLETISYIETHGTATPLGDSVELGAMTKVFQQRTEKKQFCAIGSVKPNVGHLDRASGVTGLIKTTLAMKHKLLPPSLNFEVPNPDFDWENGPFYVNTQLTPWESNGEWPRRAGVSSFGMGGTNAHVILEEVPPQPPSSDSRPYQLLLLSAKTEASLEMVTSNLAQHLQEQPDVNLADVAYTLQVGRAAFNYRRMIVVKDAADAAQALAMADPKRVFTAHQTQRERPLTFMFAGVGDHYEGMGQALYQTEAVFRQWVDRCCDLLQPHLGLDLRTVLYPEDGETAAGTTTPGQLDLRRMLGRTNGSQDHPLQQTRLAQPAVFVVSYALAQLLDSWGIQPQALIGYSLGEYTAACLAGVLSLEDALFLVARRAQMIQELEAGAMLAVPLSIDDITPYLNGEVAVAVTVAANTSILSGPTSAIAELETELQGQDVVCRRLPATHAFHSPMMQPIAESFAQLVAGVQLHPPTIPYIANVTGTWITDEQAADPAYWSQHLCQTVQFHDGLSVLLAQPDTLFLEIGPGQSLGSFVKQHPDCDQARSLWVLPSMPYAYDQQASDAFLLKTLGKMWLAGTPIEWAGFYAQERRYRVSLPTYAFEERRYWLDAKAISPLPPPSTGKKKEIGDWFYLPVWRQTPVWTIVSTESLSLNEGSWLVFMDEQGLGQRLVDRLQQAGCGVTCVHPGTTFAQQKPGHYTLDPDDTATYRQLLKALPTLPTRVVHLWSLDVVSAAASQETRFVQTQRSGFYSLLFLVQAIEQYLDHLSIWAVTGNAQPVTGTETLAPEQATLLGACRVIAQENLDIACHYIDVEWPQPMAWHIDWLAAQITAEFGHKQDDLAVAYRGQKRWVQTFEPTHLPQVSPDRPAFRHQGVYLITGGLGGVGMILAHHLAQNVQARLVLTTRSNFPAPDTWDSWLAAHEGDDPLNQKIRQLQALQAAGAEVVVLQADVADEAQMRQMLAQVDATFGTLHGVLYAAGVSDDEFFAPVQSLSMPQCEAHFQPKVYGLFVLEKVLADRTLDFCVLFSSVASVLGGLGFSPYMAANLHIDSFTHQHNQRHHQWWSSVNWDTWQVRPDQHDELGATVAQFEMLPEEGAQALARIIANGPITQIINSTGDLDARIDQWVRMVSVRDGDETQAETETILHPRPDLTNHYVAPSNETEEIIAQIWQQVLGVELIGMADHFLDLGGHSLMAMQVLSRLRRTFQINLSLSDLFEAPTVAQCAIAVELAIIEELEGLEDED